LRVDGRYVLLDVTARNLTEDELKDRVNDVIMQLVETSLPNRANAILGSRSPYSD
jgi:hypothetical protein